MQECHMCFGTGKDEDAVRAASYPDLCVNCHGSGVEPEWEDEDYDEEAEDCPECFGTGKGEGITWHCPICAGTGKV